MIYLDYAAATPVDSKVLAAMLPYLADNFYNPSAAYGAARSVRADYEAAKHRLAQTIGAKPGEIIITSGATESINLAILGSVGFRSARSGRENCQHSFSNALVPPKRSEPGDIPIPSPSLLSKLGLGGDPVARSAPLVGKSGERQKKNTGNSPIVITTAIEHPAVLECARAAGATILPVDHQGRLDLDTLAANITDQSRLISVGYANNELGTVQDIRQIAQICALERTRRAERGVSTPLVFHTDASQAAGYLDINVARLGVDLMTLNSGKCYGPKGVGMLYVRSGTELEPILRGGGQEMGLRSGTENVPGVIGFALSLEIAEKMRKTEVRRLETLRAVIKKQLSHSKDSPWKINGSQKHHLPNIINFSLPGLDGERLVYALDQRGVMVATGSACAASKGSGSYVLEAIGLGSTEADGSLRISMGRGTTKEDIDTFLKILDEVVQRERAIDG